MIGRRKKKKKRKSVREGESDRDGPVNMNYL